MSSQTLSYKDMRQGLYNKYNSIPYPTLRTMAREAGFVQRYREGRDKYTLCTFLVDREAERIEALGTHEMNFDENFHKKNNKESIFFSMTNNFWFCLEGIIHKTAPIINLFICDR